jgi:hypothetical protein
MTGFKSKQAVAQAKLTDDDDIQDYKKPWVGLTDDEKETLAYDAEGNTWMAVELAETKLKEKNT